MSFARAFPANVILLGLGAGCLFADQHVQDWSNLPPIPLPLQEIYPAVANGKIMLGGGFGKPDEGAKSPRVENRCFIFDPSRNTWSEGPPLPARRHHVHFIARNHTVLAIGGYELIDGKLWNMQHSVFTLDADQKSWTPGPDLPGARGEFSAGTIDGTVIVTGGRKMIGEKTGNRGDHTNAPDTFLLKPGSNNWVAGKPIPSPRMSGAAVVLEGRLHVLGGRVQAGVTQSSYANSAAHESYDPKTDSWQKHADLPAPVSGIASATMNGKILVFGGEDDKAPFEVHTHVWSYDPATDTWSQLPPLSTPLHGHGAITLEDGIHLLGGSTASGGSRTSDIHLLLHRPIGTQPEE